MRTDVDLKGNSGIPAKKPKIEPVKPMMAVGKQDFKKPVSTSASPQGASAKIYIEKKPVLNNAAPKPQREVKPISAKAIPSKKQEIKPAEAENEPDAHQTPSVEPIPNGHYELNSLMSRMLHNELQNIMIKVRQELPDCAPDDVEQLVANKFRNEIGDDLRSALGLNVSQRLLDLYNPLYVKLHFSCKPEAGCLQAFINKYNISAFKRIDKLQNTFAAQLKNVNDYDRLCHNNELNCGSAIITITPCYKFLQCPPALKTVYIIKDNITKKSKETGSAEKQSNASTEVKNNESNKASGIKSRDVKIGIIKVKSIESLTGKPENINTAPQIENQQTTDITSTDINTPILEEKDIKSENVTETISKVTPDKVNANVNISAVAENSIRIGITNTNETTTKVEPVISNTSININKKINEKKTMRKAQSSINDPKGAIQCKINYKQNIKKNTLIKEMIAADEDDNEEMTDEDILALMSGGIILDECSGSEED